MNNFFLYKNEQNQLIWLGIYSNKYIDAVRDIISEKSHIEFTEKVSEELVDYPDLYIWHIEKAVGKSNFIAYDDGFAIAGGYVYPEYENVVSNLVSNTPEMGMSHGMPIKDIVRNNEGVIISHITKEVSLLPVQYACNELTTFGVNMDVSLKSKRDEWIAKNGGSDALEQLGLMKDVLKEKAVVNNLLYKENKMELNDTTEVLDLSIVDIEGGEFGDTATIENTPFTPELVVKETGAEVVTPIAETPTITEVSEKSSINEVALSEPTEETTKKSVYWDMQDAMSIISDTVATMDSTNKYLVDVLSQVQRQLNGMEARLQLLEQSAAKSASVAKSMDINLDLPTASIAAMVKSKLANIVGLNLATSDTPFGDASEVKVDDTLMKQKPVENKHVSTGHVFEGFVEGF